MKRFQRWWALAAVCVGASASAGAACDMGLRPIASAAQAAGKAAGATAPRVLFVGNSFLHGHAPPVQHHNAASVTDLNGNAFNLASAGVALGLSGDTTIDLSSTSLDYELVDFAGGDDTLLGGSGNNWIESNDGNDSISGGAGNDEIESGDGDDVVSGDAGDDLITGGEGADTLTGGTGVDTFIFQQGDSTTGTYAHIGTGYEVVGGMTDGDTFTFTSGSADVITDLHNAGDNIELWSDSEGNQGFVNALSSGNWDSSTYTVGDQSYILVGGDYDSAGNFVVNHLGSDTLLIYDGDASSGVSQAAIVLVGVTTDQLTDYNSGDFEIAA